MSAGTLAYLSMSTGTRAQSAIDDTSTSSIIARPMGMISWAIDFNQTLSCIDANPMCTIWDRMFQWEPNYSLAVIKAESLYQLRKFLDVRLKLGFKSEIASYAWYI